MGLGTEALGRKIQRSTKGRKRAQKKKFKSAKATERWKPSATGCSDWEMLKKYRRNKFRAFFFKYALEIVKFKALPAAISPNIKEWFWKGWDIIRYFIFVPSSRPGFILHLGDSLKSEFWLPSKFSEFQNSVVCALCERSNLIAHQRSQLCLVNSWLKLYQDV